MKFCSSFIALGALLTSLLGVGRASAQGEKVFLRLEPGGPTSTLTALAFSPDGERLYATGFDKVVRVWALEKGRFQVSKIAYRVPVAPGFAGTINALAVSPDGKWLAAGGFGVMRGRADFRTVGRVFPTPGTKTPGQLEDEGAIFVFNVNDERDLKVLRAHAGTILALAFLPARPGKPPMLVSAAEEPTGKGNAYGARVRLWDIAKGESLAEKTIDTTAPRKTPGLAAWRTGGDPSDVAVAIAWQDTQVRLWDVAGGTVAKADDGKYNNVVAAGAAAREFWTASFESPDGVVRLWRADPGQPPRTQPRGEVKLAAEDATRGPFYIPRDLASFPSRLDGPIDRAVVLARRQGADAGPDDQDVLFLLDLAGSRVLARVPLGKFQFNVRRVAASPSGKHIAVADADDQQVRVFATADLLGQQEKARPQQVLRGVGTSFEKVSFRKQGDDRALYLKEVGGAEMLFDFTGRNLVANDEAWRKDSPDATEWRVVPKLDGGRTVVTVSGPDFEARTIALEEGSTLTAGALLPPRKGSPFGPVLAAAWLDAHRQPRLALYDVGSGVQVRQLAGHVGVVRSLAFSADGRLLASAAADQTVCLWSLTSLGQVLGTAGALPGVVTVLTKDKTLEVAHAPDDSPLKEGTLLEGFVEGGKLRPLPTPLEFHNALFETKPGTTVIVRARRPGAAAAADIKVTVGQGTDERKPLLSLFVTRGDKPEKRDWIAWTSLGPYDRSTLTAENYLGWHYNPDKAGEPIGFVRAEKHREKYYKGDVRILGHVVREANVTEALKKAAEKERPQMQGRIDGISPDAPIVIDRPLVRTRDLTLRLEIPAPFPLERVSAVLWQLDGGDWKSLGKPAGRELAVDLSKLPWGRGRHDMAVRLETDGGTLNEPWKAAFHYLPARPRIEFAKGWLARNFTGAERREWLAKQVSDAVRTAQVAPTKEGSFRLEADVQPMAPGEDVHVTVRHNDGKPQPVQGLNVLQDFKLQEGRNVFEISAVNARAWKDLETEETATVKLYVNYDREHPAPQVVVREVVPVGAGAERLRVELGKPVSVSVPKVRVVGQVVGEEDLQQATRDGRPLRAFAAGTQKQFDFEEELVLKPGSHEVRFAARTAKSPEGWARVRIDYKPPVAGIRTVRPVDGSKVYEPAVGVRAELAPSDHQEKYTAELLIDGTREGEQQQLGAGDTEFKASARLKPGPNRLVVRLHNEWGAEAGRELLVTYLRLPVISKFPVPREVEKPVLDVSALVDSPADLKPCAAQLNDRPFRDDRLLAVLDPEAKRWKVTLRDVELQEGDNTLTLFVANQDGRSHEPATANVRYTKRKPPVPVVKFRDLQSGEHYEVAAPEQTLRFVVDSGTPLHRVELRGRGDEVLYRAGADDLKKVRFEILRPVKLLPGEPTTFHLLAVNEGGQGEAHVTLHLPPRPAYVVIERLELLRTPGKTIQPRADGNDGQGRVVFDEVPEGRVKLYGRIYWKDPAEARKHSQIPVRVYANGFQQIPIEAPPPREGESQSPFTATVLLTLPTRNVIEVNVNLPDVGVADGQRSACVVGRCTNPIRGRRLHLVVVGIGEKDGAGLKRRALDAIGARETPGAMGQFQAPPAFDVVLAYPPLVGGVSKWQVINKLQEVKVQIKATADEGKDVVLSDVVMLYYKGRERLTPSGHYLLTDDSELKDDPKDTDVSCEEIVSLFRDTRGAQVVMLDVERVAAAKAEAQAPGVARAFDGTRLGVFHSFWLAEGNAPATGLLGLLQQGWGQADTLDHLAREVEGLRARLAPQLRFYRYIPGELALLEFGGKQP
jgi:WD40 repeat protein